MFGNDLLIIGDWLIEMGGFICDGFGKDGLDVVVIWVVNVFKYFCVEVERELRGVVVDVGWWDEVMDIGFNGDINVRLFWENEIIVGILLLDVDRDVMGVVCLIGVGVIGDVIKGIGESIVFLGRFE